MAKKGIRENVSIEPQSLLRECDILRHHLFEEYQIKLEVSFHPLCTHKDFLFLFSCCWTMMKALWYIILILNYVPSLICFRYRINQPPMTILPFRFPIKILLANPFLSISHFPCCLVEFLILLPSLGGLRDSEPPYLMNYQFLIRHHLYLIFISFL